MGFESPKIELRSATTLDEKSFVLSLAESEDGVLGSSIEASGCSSGVFFSSGELEKIELKSTFGFSSFFSFPDIPIELSKSSIPSTSFFSPRPIVSSKSSISPDDSPAKISVSVSESINIC